MANPATAAPTSAMLFHRHLFGLKGNVKNNVAFAEENVVVYPCGHNIVIHNMETKEQQFIHGLDTGSLGGITALTVSTNKRFIGVAEQCDKAVVHIHDLTTLRRKKSLTLSDNQSDVCVWIAFSADSKYCLTQGGAPDWTLSIWLWEKTKIVATVKTSNQAGSTISQADFCPGDPSIVCVSGNGIIKFFKIVDSQLRLQPLPLKREPSFFLCHTWISDDRVIAAADTGELWLFENLEFRQVLATSPNDGNFVNFIVGYSKGFVCGGSGGIVRLYDRSEDAREFYKKSKSFSIEGNTSNINTIAISPAEDSLVCALENNQLYTLTLSSSDILKEDAMNFELLSTSFHAPGTNGSHVTGLDVCVRKPLVVTTGFDKSVRVWNYLDRSMDIMKFFKEDIYSVAFHPSGLQIIVGFADKLKMLNILMDDIRAFREFAIKACKEVRFSHGGQFFAAVNNNVVQVYSTYTGDLVGVLRGHSNRVNAILWKQDDRKLFTCGSDGLILTWYLRTATKVSDGHSQARCVYHDVSVTHDGDLVFASGSDGLLKEIDVASGVTRLEHTVGQSLGPLALTLSQQVLFAGTNEPGKPGTIRAYKLPIESDNGFTEVQCHDLPVTRLRLSFDNQFLFSTGEDGSLCIFETKVLPPFGKSTQQVARGRENRTGENAIQFAEEILVTRSDLEEKNRLMNELKTKVDELMLHNEYQLRLKDMNYKEKIKEVSDKFTAELAQDRQRCTDLAEDKSQMETDYNRKIQEMINQHKQEYLDLKATYEAKIQVERERHQVLEQARGEQNARFEEENHLLVESHAQFLSEMTAQYDQKVSNEQEMQSKLSKAKDELVNSNEELKRQLEEDAELEIEEMKFKYENKLQEEREATLRLKGENGIMKKKFSALQKDIEDQKEEIRSLEEKSKELGENIKGLEKDIQGHKKEIREREETIQDKEKRIYDLKKKNQELEKFKFVLDYKIKELKRQIEPRENEITEMKKQIEEMDLELEQYHKSNAALDLMIGELRLKMDGMQKEIHFQQEQVSYGNKLIHQIQLDLVNCGQFVAEEKKLKTAIIALNKKYENGVKFDGKEANSQTEYNRQREYLEKEVESLKRKIIKGMEMKHTELSRLQRENSLLTSQVNELRREFHQVKMQTKQVEESKARQQQQLLLAKHKSPDFAEKIGRMKFQNGMILQLKERLTSLQKAMGGALNFTLPQIKTATKQQRSTSQLPTNQDSRPDRNSELERLPPVVSSSSSENRVEPNAGKDGEVDG